MQGVCWGRNFAAKWVTTGGECNKLSPILAHLHSISILPASRMHLGGQHVCVLPHQVAGQQDAAVQSPGQVGQGGAGLVFPKRWNSSREA